MNVISQNTLNRIDELEAELTSLREDKARLMEALTGILEIGKRDMSNPKYDGYFEDARAAIDQARGKS